MVEQYLVTSWRTQTLPPSIVGGPGSAGTEELASQLADALCSKGYLASLDYSLAFDYVLPEAIATAMKQVGLPHGLANVLQAQWSNQKRILQWRQSCYQHPLRTSIAIPQGDPMSPLALNILMWAGQRFVERESPCAAGERLHVVYMDDRTWCSNTPRLLLHTLDTWHQFSTAIGLKENIAKTQLTYNTL